MGIIGARDFNFTMDLRALFDGDPNGQDVPADFSGAANLHALASTNRAFHRAADNDFAGIDVRGNFAVRPDRNPAFGKMDGALHFSVDIQIFPAPYFPFNYQ